MSRRSLARVARTFTALAALSSAACGTDDGDRTLHADELPGSPNGPDAPSTPSKPEKSGSLSFELKTADDAIFTSFSYVISGPSYTKSGRIDVSESNTVSAVIEAIPVASGYSLTLQGDSVEPVKASCSGSATFDITAGTITTVPVAVACHLEPDGPVEPVPTSVPVPHQASGALGMLLVAAGALAISRQRKVSAKR